MKVKDWIQSSPRDDAGFPISDWRQDWKFSKGERNCRRYKGRLSAERLGELSCQRMVFNGKRVE